MEIFLIWKYSINIIYERIGYIAYFIINILLPNLQKDE